MEAEAPTITNIIASDLADPGRLVELHRQAIELGWASDCYLGPTGELAFVSAAVHAQRIVRQHGKGDPVRLFAWFARGLDKPVRSNGTATPDPEQFDIAVWEDEQLAKWENGEDRTNRRSDFITNDDEQIAHWQIKRHRYGELPRGALSLSTDARFVQHFVRIARNHRWYEKPERLFAMLKDRLGDEWTQGRWDDACEELRDGGGPIHVGKVVSAYLADRGIIEPTVKLFQAEESVQGVA